MVIRKQITIEAPPELIWDVITDLKHAKEWAPGFEDYPYISPDWPAADSTAVWRYHAGFMYYWLRPIGLAFAPLMHFDFDLRLTQSDRGRALHIANRSAFGTGMEIYRFEQRNGATTIHYEATSTPNALGRLFAAAMKRKLEKQMDQTIANLKRFCESNAGKQISL